MHPFDEISMAEPTENKEVSLFRWASPFVVVLVFALGVVIKIIDTAPAPFAVVVRFVMRGYLSGSCGVFVSLAGHNSPESFVATDTLRITVAANTPPQNFWIPVFRIRKEIVSRACSIFSSAVSISLSISTVGLSSISLNSSFCPPNRS